MTGQPPPCLWADQGCYFSDADNYCVCFDDDLDLDVPPTRPMVDVPTGEYL